MSDPFDSETSKDPGLTGARTDAKRETNWVGRAQKKQERIRSEQERALGLLGDAEGKPADEGAPAATVAQAGPTHKQINSRLLAGFALGCAALAVVSVFDLKLKDPEAESAAEIAALDESATDPTPPVADDPIEAVPEPEPVAEEEPQKPRVLRTGNSAGRWHSVNQ